MPRSDSIQRPTTLLSLKSNKSELSEFDYPTGIQFYEQNRLIFDALDTGVLTGEVRYSTGNTGVNEDKTYSLLPLGSIIYFAGSTPPAGYLFCNGALYDKDLYIELYNYLGASDPSSPYHWRHDLTKFRVPDFSNSGNPDRSRERNRQGGLFIRNLNQSLPDGNDRLPDYNTEFWDEMNVSEHNVGENSSLTQIRRLFGSIQEEEYPSHNHKHLTANTSETGENHSHKYFLSEGATNGVGLGELNSLGAGYGDIVVRSGLVTSDAGAVYDTIDAGSVIPRATPTIDISSFDNATLAAMLAANTIPPLTGQQFDIGAHVHTGWLGYGASKYKTDSLHNTYHRTANSEHRQDFSITSNTYNITSERFLNNYFEIYPQSFLVGANREKNYTSIYRLWPERTDVTLDGVELEEGVDFNYSYDNMQVLLTENPPAGSTLQVDILINESEYYELYKNDVLLTLNNDYIIDNDDRSITLYDQAVIGESFRLIDLSNFNNATETQPKNYSLLFCIKY